MDRTAVEDSLHAKEAGGLSGKPLLTRSTEVVKQLYGIVQNRIPIIASGGIMSAKDAQEKIAAGASLVQLYTGIIYQGPGLIEQCVKKIKGKYVDKTWKSCAV